MRHPLANLISLPSRFSFAEANPKATWKEESRVLNGETKINPTSSFPSSGSIYLSNPGHFG
jgi:hypothetical protein